MTWIFGGRQHPALAREVAAVTGSRLGRTKIGNFADGEISIQIVDDVYRDSVVLVQPTHTAEAILELVLLADALKRCRPRRLVLVLPYFGYQRQERRTDRSPVSAQVIAGMVNNTQADLVLTLDLHAPAIHRFVALPHCEMHSTPLFADAVKGLRPGDRPMVVVSPDRGGITRARRLSRALSTGRPALALHKIRPSPDQCEVSGEDESVSVAGKHAILVDDASSTGGTLCEAAATLHRMKAAPIWACVTHLAGDPDKLMSRVEASHIDRLLITDSLPGREPKQGSKLRQLHLAPLIGSALSQPDGARPRPASVTGTLRPAS